MKTPIQIASPQATKTMSPAAVAGEKESSAGNLKAFPLETFAAYAHQSPLVQKQASLLALSAQRLSRRDALRMPGSAHLVQQRAAVEGVAGSSRMLAQRDWIRKVSSTPGSSQAAQAPVQKVRVLLSDEDPGLFGLLREVPVPNAGAQTCQDPAGVENLKQIGDDESIVFEGHGNGVKLGGRLPKDLADFARRVPKSPNWAGDIYLMGCKTGNITEAVSMNYYNLTGRSVAVKGMKTSIAVGSDVHDGLFIGTDLENEPVSDRPADLAFINELFGVIILHPTAIASLSKLFGKLIQFNETQTTGITENLEAIDQAWAPFAGIDATTANPQTHGANYKLPERQAIHQDFVAVREAIRNISVFQYPDVVRPSVNQLQEALEIEAAADLFRAFGNQKAAVLRLNQYFHGLRLRRIDLTNPDHITSSKKARALGIFYWTDR